MSDLTTAARSKRDALASRTDVLDKSAPDEGFTGPQIVEMAEAANVKKSAAYQALKWLVSEEYVKNIGTQHRSRYVLGDRQL